MIQNNEGLNSSRTVANNGQKFVEGATATGVFYGFMPHKDGCKVTAITITDKNGNTIDETDADVATWIATTLDLDSFMGAGLVASADGVLKGYITSITVTGAATLYKDTLAP